MTVGKVWLVGAGPGDPGLITVRGRAMLERADAVLYDALAHPALLEACPNAEQRDVGKRYGEASAAQSAINAELIALARAGKRVVRLKGGDPLMFARGAEEALALAEAGIPFEIVPGVSSPLAVSAYAGISLTHRELSSSVTFITGSDRAGVDWSPESWQKLATATDTICVLMGMRRIEEITRAIIDGGRSPDALAAVIQWGARSEQRVVTATVATIAARVRAENIKNPALILIGEVVSLREHMRWFDNRPLFGKSILVPRPAQQGRATAEAIRERGAEAILLPLITIAEPPDKAPLGRALSELSQYEYVLFTSANGVEQFFRALLGSGRDARAFGHAKIGVVGPKTADALAACGLRADVVAAEFVGEGLARAVLERGTPGRVLVARALVARDALPEALRAAGANVDVVPVYETRSVEDVAAVRELFEQKRIDAVLFTSSSTAQALVSALGEKAAELLRNVCVSSIGPITSKTLAELSIPVDVTAAAFTIEGQLDALEAHFKA
jgi:uroporphyrinogen III methyltransferase / synthase